MTSMESEMIKAERNAYYKEWRKKNPDKARAIQERYWLKRARARQKEA